MMKLSWGHVAAGVLALAALAGIYQTSPSLRAAVAAQGREWLGWTEAARRADPIGFTNHVEHRLKADVGTLQRCRQELLVGADELGGKLAQQIAYRDQARKLTEEFRAAYQSAQQSGTFPVQIRNASYGDEQLVAQVSLLLAETEGFDATVGRLEKIRQQAGTRLQEIVVRLNATEAQLAAIAAQRGLLRARELTTEGESLIAQVDELLEVNHTVLSHNPVRPLAELLSSADPVAPVSGSLDKARQYLAESTAVKDAR